ncbi:MAG TPA: phage baseplate assembly protein V [Pyrinomonadaceae bacterium]
MNILDLLTYDTEREAHTTRIYGVVVGVVTNNEDPEKLGRVKVRFPWLNDEDESTWARIATLRAKQNVGTWFLPDVDDEVLVAFEHGDVRFPYVIGGLWNGVDTPPRDNADGKNNEMVIRSKLGHEFVFYDDANKGHIQLKTEQGHEIMLDDSAGSEKITIKDKTGDNSLTFDSAASTIEIKSGAKVVIVAAQEMEIKADSSLSIEARSIEIKGDSIKIESSGPMDVKSSAMLTVKGSLVQIN